MSVTAISYRRSRNGQYVCLCHDRVLTHGPDDPCPRYYTFHAHCWVCHHNDHNTCEGCGRCIGKSRSDRRYCSDACRQRAYRLRVAA
jgi:hypothetical protein